MRYLSLILLLMTTVCVQADDLLDSALARAGDNRPELERALEQVPQSQREGMELSLIHI